MPDEPRTRRAMASVYLAPDDVPFIVVETPSEVAAIIKAAHDAGEPLAKLTLGNASEWNAKPLYVRPASVVAVSPPKDLVDEDEDEC